jgi:hypothetical protein
MQYYSGNGNCNSSKTDLSVKTYFTERYNEYIKSSVNTIYSICSVCKSEPEFDNETLIKNQIAGELRSLMNSVETLFTYNRMDIINNTQQSGMFLKKSEPSLRMNSGFGTPNTSKDRFKNIYIPDTVVATPSPNRDFKSRIFHQNLMDVSLNMPVHTSPDEFVAKPKKINNLVVNLADIDNDTDFNDSIDFSEIENMYNYENSNLDLNINSKSNSKVKVNVDDMISDINNCDFMIDNIDDNICNGDIDDNLYETEGGEYLPGEDDVGTGTDDQYGELYDEDNPHLSINTINSTKTGKKSVSIGEEFDARNIGIDMQTWANLGTRTKIPQKNTQKVSAAKTDNNE